MRIRTFLVPALLLLAFSAQAGEKFYKWKDETGTWHYTRTPPPAGAQAENVQVKGSSVSAGAAAPPPSATPAAAPGPGASPAAPMNVSVASNSDRGAQCEKARAYQARLSENAYVAMDTDGDGKPELASDEQRAKEIERANLAVKLACE